jgi:hypothetical protein
VQLYSKSLACLALEHLSKLVSALCSLPIALNIVA